MGKFTMSRKKSQQIPIFDRLVRQEPSQSNATKMLGITNRQVRNKLKRYHGISSPKPRKAKVSKVVG